MDYRGLTIGDWLLDKEEGFARRVVQVTDAAFDGCGAGVILENGMDYQECEPIPLTAEILEKNEFDIAILNNKEPEAYLRMGYLNDDGEMEDVAYDIILDHHKTYWELTIINNDKGCRIDININYVHELQHALRLCGIDKTIEL